MLKKKVKKIIEEIVGQSVEIFRPGQAVHGDYSTNLALQQSVETQLLIEKLRKHSLFERVELAGPGFINFYLAPLVLEEELSSLVDSFEKYLELKLGQGQKIQVEFISANPTGPLTVANGRGGPWGDVLANLLNKVGYRVEKAYYINDYGSQILALGHSVLKDSEAKYQGEYIDRLSQQIKEKDPYLVGEKAAQLIIDQMIKPTVEKMGIVYDQWYSETALHRSGYLDQVIKSLKEKGLVYQKDGASWFKSSQFGDQRDRVLIKRNGWKTYLAGDIAFHFYKFKEKGFDQVINLWGADHHGDLPGLLAGLEALGLKDRLKTIFFQFVTLWQKGEKRRMAKRSGFYVTMDDLLAEVGPDVLRYFYLEKSPQTHLNFNLSLAKEQSEKNPVYYIQYAYARLCSIFQKALKETSAKKKVFRFSSSEPARSAELSLVKHLLRYPEIIEETAKDCQLQRLPHYAHQLAGCFHRFYEQCRVLTEERSVRQSRLLLAQASQLVFRDLLALMGLAAPEKM